MTTDSSVPLLWHYTSFRGLFGIVVEDQLMASSMAYLNDTEEFEYATKSLINFLEGKGQTVADLVRGSSFENPESVVKAMFKYQLRGDRHYLTCFSKERDDLSQWRSYTPNPPGFAIGFKPDELEALANSHGFQMVECTYSDESELLATVEAAYNAAIVGMDEETRALPIPSSKETLEQFSHKWALQIINAMLEFAPRTKHPKFVAEKEVRLVTRVRAGDEGQSNVQYRLSGSLVVPFIKFPAREMAGGLSPIKEILVGPCPHQDAVIRATQQMCMQHRVRPRVRPSAVPYRNW